MIFFTLVFGAFMAKRTESVLIGEVWAVFALIVMLGLYFVVGAMLR